MGSVDNVQKWRMTPDEELLELQSFSRHLMAKLDESRNMGQFGQAEIDLLRKKLSVVVDAFSAERQKIEEDLNTVCATREAAEGLLISSEPSSETYVFFSLLEKETFLFFRPRRSFSFTSFKCGRSLRA